MAWTKPIKWKATKVLLLMLEHGLIEPDGDQAFRLTHKGDQVRRVWAAGVTP